METTPNGHGKIVRIKQDSEVSLHGFKLTATGLVPQGNPSYDEWYSCGVWLRHAEGAIGFWIGDWIRYGEKRSWGEQYSQALDETGLDYQTLRDYKYVASKVDLSLRNDKLGFHHHRAVAKLPPPEQKKFLARAAKEELSVDDLRLAIKKQQLKEHHAALPKFDSNGTAHLDRLTILHGDSRQFSKSVNGLHLVFLSPPYNVGIEYGEHNDSMDQEEYFTLLHDLFVQSYEALVTGGRIGVVVPSGIGRNPYMPLAPFVQSILTGAGFTLRGEIVWDKATAGNRTSWGSWMSASNPALRDRTERVLIAHKITPELEICGPSLIRDGDEFMALAQDVWQIPPESAERVKHPAPFPVELAERFIRFYGYAGCKVGDLCMGSGSTLIAALRLGCEAFGMDISKTFCALARERIKEELTAQPLFI